MTRDEKIGILYLAGFFVLGILLTLGAIGSTGKHVHWEKDFVSGCDGLWIKSGDKIVCAFGPGRGRINFPDTTWSLVDDACQEAHSVVVDGNDLVCRYLVGDMINSTVEN